jgi:predicted DNA-binding protein
VEPVQQRWPDDLVERVDAAAAEVGQTQTEFTRRALEAMLDDLTAAGYGVERLHPTAAGTRYFANERCQHA